MKSNAFLSPFPPSLLRQFQERKFLKCVDVAALLWRKILPFFASFSHLPREKVPSFSLNKVILFGPKSREFAICTREVSIEGK